MNKYKNISFLAPICCLIVLWSLTGCDYKKAEREGLKDFPDVQKFNQMFKTTTHKVDGHGGLGGPLSWQSRGIVYDHYLVIMQFDVSVDMFRSPRRVSSVGLRVDQYRYRYTTGRKRRARRTLGVISEEQWRDVKEPDDIFRFLNHVPIKNEPIDGIEEDLKFH